MSRALVICGHPDDEVIGLGGTIKKLTKQGVEIIVAIFANGNEGYGEISLKEKIVKIRKEERKKVQRILGISQYEAFDYTDFGIPTNEETYKLCIKLIRRYKPDCIFTHYWLDYMAHRAVATVATEAWWQSGWKCSLDLGNPWKAKSLYHFEILELLTKPSHIVDITDTFEYKIKAMKAYASQVEVVPGILEQLEGLAKLRGSAIGVKYGEAFLKSNFLPDKIERFKEF